MKIHESAKSSQNRSTMDLMSDEFCDAYGQVFSIRAALPLSPKIFDNRSLHQACKEGDLKLVEELTLKNRNLCFKISCAGTTALHVAARNGRIDVVKLILRHCFESVKELTATTMETCLDVAIRDYEGNTAMEISTLQNGPYEMKKIDESAYDSASISDLLLSMDAFRGQDCRARGHWGMGGLGKTTIAEVIYNQEARLKRARFFDDTVLHLACNNGNLKLVEQLILLDWNWCLTKDWLGETPLHIAAMSGKVEGNTALQFYFSSKLLKSIGVLHRGKFSDANALNSGGSMALDTSYYLPHSENVEIVTDKILHKPRDTGLSNNSGALRGDVYSHGGLSNRRSYINAFKSIIGFRISLLLTATLFATITYQVPFHLHDSTARERSEHYLIILFNSVVFISSVGVIIFVLHEFPLKPWPHISISSVFGSYMFSLNAIMPDGTLVLLFISIPILLVCFFGKTLWLCKLKFYWSI